MRSITSRVEMQPWRWPGSNLSDICPPLLFLAACLDLLIKSGSCLFRIKSARTVSDIQEIFSWGLFFAALVSLSLSCSRHLLLYSVLTSVSYSGFQVKPRYRKHHDQKVQSYHRDLIIKILL